MLKLLVLLWHYSKAKRKAFTTREALTLHQQTAFQSFQKKITRISLYFARYKNRPLQERPLMNKTVMLQHFNEMNTAGITLEDAYQTAFKAEQSRDFSPLLKGYTIGLSSGTSGTRGVFLVSPQEQAQWAGTILAKLLPRTLFSFYPFKAIFSLLKQIKIHFNCILKALLKLQIKQKLILFLPSNIWVLILMY